MRRRKEIQQKHDEIRENIKSAAEHLLNASVAVKKLYTTAVENTIIKDTPATRIRQRIDALPPNLRHDKLVQCFIYFEETTAQMEDGDRTTHYLFEPEWLAELDIQTLHSLATQIHLAIERKTDGKI